MYGDVPEVIRRSELQTILPENVEDKSIVGSACGKRGADVQPDSAGLAFHKFKLTSLESGIALLIGSRAGIPRQQCQSGSLPPVASRRGPIHALVH
jgi:hypothetical protein